MSKKVCIVFIVLALISMSPLFGPTQQELRSSPDSTNNNGENSISPSLPFYGPEPKPEGYVSQPKPQSPPPPPPLSPSSKGPQSSPPPPSGKKPSEDMPELNAVIEGAVDIGDHLIGSYVDNATSKVKNLISSKKPTTQLEVDKTMLNDSVQVGDDTIDLLLARDKVNWQAFIDKEFEKNPQALVETLVPLYQFNPKDAKELTQYIENRKDYLGVRTLVDHTANLPDWVAAQEGMEQVSVAESFGNSPEAQAIRKEFTGRLKESAQKEGQKMLKDAEKQAEKKAEEAWAKLRTKMLKNK